MADRVLHYHTFCGRAFYLDASLEAGDPCPVCGKPFGPPVVQHTCDCERVATMWLSNLRKNVGEEFICPIHNKLVTVVRRSDGKTAVPAKPPSPSVTSPSSGINALVLALVAISVALLMYTVFTSETFQRFLATPTPTFTPTFTPSATPTPTPSLTSMPTLTPSATPLPTSSPPTAPSPMPTSPPWRETVDPWYLFLDLFLLLLLLVMFVASLYLLFQAIAWLAKRPQDTQRQLDDLSAELAKNEAALEVIDESQQALNQQNEWIGGLVIALALVAFWCRLDVQSAEQARSAITQFAMQGAITVIIFAILFFAVRMFRRLEGISFLANLPNAVLVSGLYGVSTVMTMLLAPFFMGSVLVLDSIANGLMQNLVTDVCISFYEDRLRRWYNRTRRLALGDEAAPPVT